MGDRIAIVDDTDGTRYALRRTLENAGFDVIEGRNGEDALRLALQQPDLMVLDVHMPDMMGYEAARRIKADPQTKHIPVLHLSASFTTELDRAVGLDAGADAYLTEPVETPLLLATIHALLRQKTAERVAQRALKARDELMSATAHDVRGLLMAVRLGLEAQLRRAREREIDREALTRSIQRSVRELDSTSRLMQDLLDGAQIDAHKVALHAEPADLAVLTAEVVERYQLDAQAAGCTLSLDAPAPVAGEFDVLRVQQILENLISNAIKYGDHKPVSVRVRADGDEAELAVVDQGRGIAPAEQGRIFERFERAPGELRPGSYGLGLWIVREIVRLYRGRISLQSAPGKGSTFTVRLPRSF